jgi:ComF family protein
MPDAIVPVPLSFIHRMNRGYNQSALLAQFFANFVQCPVHDILKRKSGDFSQAQLNRSHRLLLDKEKFSCDPKFNALNKIVLLIDDVMTTGSTLNRCAETIQSLYPQKLYALVICKAVS